MDKPHGRKSVAVKEEAEAFSSTAAPAPDSSFVVDVLRQCLHEKIGEACSQGNARKLFPTSLEKRCWRKLRQKEWDRK